MPEGADTGFMGKKPISCGERALHQPPRNTSPGATTPAAGGQGQLTEQLNIDLLQRVDAAELVQLVVDLVEDQSFVVVSCVVLHDVVDWKRRESGLG